MDSSMDDGDNAVVATGAGSRSLDGLNREFHRGRVHLWGFGLPHLRLNRSMIVEKLWKMAV